MGLDSGLTWSVVYELCFGYCVEGAGVHHEVSDAFTKVNDLNPDVPEEGISGPLPNYHDFYGYALARKSSMEKPDRSEWVLTSL